MQLQQFDMPGTRYPLQEIRTLFSFFAKTLTSDLAVSSRACFSKNQKTDRSNIDGSTATLNETAVSSRTLGPRFCWRVFRAKSYELQHGHAEATVYTLQFREAVLFISPTPFKSAPTSSFPTIDHRFVGSSSSDLCCETIVRVSGLLLLKFGVYDSQLLYDHEITDDFLKIASGTY